MNLAAAVTLTRIGLEFGGPGSGCRGPNCGRKASGKSTQPSEMERIYKVTGDPVPLDKLKELGAEETGGIPTWVHGWLNEDGYAVGQDIIHPRVMELAKIPGYHSPPIPWEPSKPGYNAGYSDKSVHDFMARNNLIRASTGNYFEYPLVDIHTKPTSAQMASIGKMWNYVKDNPRWSKYGLTYELHHPSTGESVKSGGGVGFHMGDLMRDIESTYGK